MGSMLTRELQEKCRAVLNAHWRSVASDVKEWFSARGDLVSSPQPTDTWQGLETVWVISTGEGRMLPASGGQRAGMLLSIPQRPD